MAISAERVVVAMSGGVDSSLAAAILKNEGYRVIGVTMRLQAESEVVERARRVAKRLAIPHYVADFRDIFSRMVITDFCRQYSLGRTPNPCISCNHHIKFGALLNKAKELGATFLATGHYARVAHSANGYRLLKAVDPGKDQSYFLYILGQRQLEYLLLPIGNLRKPEVREMASDLGLTTAQSQESQDICFIPDSDYRSFITEHIPLKPGNIVDTEGRLLGRHKGLALHTVGQRQGLGLASARRLYVLRLDVNSNRVIVGSEDQLLANRLSASHLRWVSDRAPTDDGNITARIRYRAPEVAVRLHIKNGTAQVQFDQPQRAVAPGQAVVFYQGEAVLGGGIIEPGNQYEEG